MNQPTLIDLPKQEVKWQYIARISEGVWLSSLKDGRGRTSVRENAKRFATPKEARLAQIRAMQSYPECFHPNVRAVIEFYVKPTNTCRNCRHRERHEAGSMATSYCGIRKSNRTQNGKLKIKAKDPACAGFEGER
jgi:hypothetical protein